MRDLITHIVLIHVHGQQDKYRLDFKTEIPITDIYERLKPKGYKIFQLILDDNLYVMPQSELIKHEIEFDKLVRIKKTWFGFGRKTVTDILIYPQADFYYPYEFGTYTYLFSKQDYSKEQFSDWLSKQFPKGWSDLDDTYAGLNTETVEMLNAQDFLLITNHDYQTEFGIIGNKSIIENILNTFRKMDLTEYKEKIYRHN